MTKMTRYDRGRTVIAMDRMARCVNDEDLFLSWLMLGVADGDITADTKPDDSDLDCYCVDECFKDLLTLFNRLMHHAWLDGGLYDSGICGMDKSEWRSKLNEN